MERSDIIYYVLLGIFLLSGLFRKRKKAAANANTQAQQPIPVASHTETTDFDDWFLKDEAQQVVPAAIKSVTPEKTFKTHENTNDFASLRAEKKVVQQMKQSKFEEPIKLNDNINSNNINLNIELNTPEDARRAFVYSEIFQRKY
jgi:hypothetical protein